MAPHVSNFLEGQRLQRKAADIHCTLTKAKPASSTVSVTDLRNDEFPLEGCQYQLAPLPAALHPQL